MNNQDKDYFFFINWEDADKNAYRIGVLAQIEKMFYLRMNSKENSKAAYDKGCIGIPGFKRNVVYKSEELFDFFKSRILDKNSEKPFEELSVTLGKSMVDSFELEEVPERLRQKCKEVILEMSELQEKAKKLEEARSL